MAIKSRAEQVSAGDGDPGQAKHDVILRDDGKDLSRICGGGDRKRCNSAAVGYGEQHPAVEKGHQVAVGFAQINVLSAGLGEHGTQLGEGGAAEQRNYAADHPHQQKQHGLRQRPGNVFGGEKNRGADDAADQEQHRIEQAESANQGRLRGRGRGSAAGRRESIIRFRVRREIPAACRSGGR